MDLNADLGEGFGSWPMGDDDALLDVVTSANVACGFHAGDPSIMRRVTAHGGRARGRDRRARRVRRQGRLRPPVRRHRAGRAARRGRLPDRRTGRVRPDRGRPGPVREAARRAVQHDRAPRGAGRGCRRRGRRLRPHAAGARAAGIGLAAARCRGRADRRTRGLRGPCVHARRALWCPDVRPGRCCTTRTRSRRGVRRWRQGSRSLDTTAAR